jgi:hypothetical protein
MHICWIPAHAFGAGCSLSAALNRPDSSALGRSLVVASPKHMGWTLDPALSRLPADPESAYIFHDTVPPAFDDLKRRGRAIEWRLFGPDGNFPFMDSLLFARSSLSPSGVEGSGCAGFVCGDVESRTYVSPWATPLPPSRIRPYGTSTAHPSTNGSARVHFIGSVWHGNSQLFAEFVSGCNRAGVPLVRHGARPLPSALRALVESDDARRLSSAERDNLMATSAFAIAVQGRSHLRGRTSYIADRPLLAASMGLVVATNNENVGRLLSDFNVSVAFNENASELCGTASAHAARRLAAGAQQEQTAAQDLARFMKERHTYLSRFADLTGMLVAASSSESTRGDVAAADRLSSGDSPWCSATSIWSRHLEMTPQPLNITGLPTVFIIGAQLAGQSIVAEKLRGEHDLCGPAVDDRTQAHFFDTKGEVDEMELAEYRALYSHCADKLRLDATPEYMMAATSVAASLMSVYAHALPRLRFIAVVRDPVARLAAALSMELERCAAAGGEDDAPRRVLCRALKDDSYPTLLAEATSLASDRCTFKWNLVCQGVDYGSYVAQLSTWLVHVRPSQLLVMHFDDLTADSIEVRSGAHATLARFLGIAGQSASWTEEKAPRPFRLTWSAECAVRRFYEAPNSDLVDLLRSQWPERAPFASSEWNAPLHSGFCSNESFANRPPRASAGANATARVRPSRLMHKQPSKSGTPVAENSLQAASKVSAPAAALARSSPAKTTTPTVPLALKKRESKHWLRVQQRRLTAFARLEARCSGLLVGDKGKGFLDGDSRALGKLYQPSTTGPTMFVVLSRERSGSNLLVDLLNRHPDVLCHAEALHIGGSYSQLPTPISTKDRDADRDGFIETLFKCTRKNKGYIKQSVPDVAASTVGFKAVQSAATRTFT